MENHPIPQDVTGFQFKLIGEMTIKQFAYLAGGVILAWITYALPLFALIKFPLILLFGGLGVCLAFVPVEGRPFDVMMINFLKALTSPTEFVYKKAGYTVLPQVHVMQKVVTPKQVEKEHQEKAAISEKKLQSYLNTLPKTPRNSLDEKEMRFLGGLPLASNSPYTQIGQTPFAGTPTILHQQQAQSQPQVAQSVMVGAQPVVQQTPSTPSLVADMPQQTAPQAPMSEEQEQQQKETLEKEAALLQQELTTAKQQESVQQSEPTKAVAHEKVVELEKELSDILAQKETLQNQLITLKKELEAQKQQVFSPSLATPQAKQQTQNVRLIPQGMAKSVGLPITPDVPNLLTGIVKDARGNTLPNILVEVKDKDNNPVRAFKTNGLGQFAAATPLANGIYLLTFEDPNNKQKFDTVELPVNGAIIQPMEVISVDDREQLRKELFQA